MFEGVAELLKYFGTLPKVAAIVLLAAVILLVLDMPSEWLPWLKLASVLCASAIVVSTIIAAWQMFKARRNPGAQLEQQAQHAARELRLVAEYERGKADGIVEGARAANEEASIRVTESGLTMDELNILFMLTSRSKESSGLTLPMIQKALSARVVDPRRAIARLDSLGLLKRTDEIWLSASDIARRSSSGGMFPIKPT